MVEDLTIRYVCNGIETTLTIKDEHYDNITLSDEAYEMYLSCGYTFDERGRMFNPNGDLVQ